MIDVFVFVCAVVVCVSCFVELHAMSIQSPVSYLIGFALCGCAAFGFALNVLLPIELDTNPELIEGVMLLGLAMIGLSSRRSPWRLLWHKSRYWNGLNRRHAPDDNQRQPLAKKIDRDFFKGDGL